MELKDILMLRLQRSIIMCHIKDSCILSLIVMLIFSSCTIGVKRLSNLFGKKLSTPQGHLFSSSQLVIYSDSTFEYTEGGPALKYSKGKWIINGDKKSITLISLNQHYVINKHLVDTVFLNFDSINVKIKRKNKVVMNSKVFSLSN